MHATISLMLLSFQIGNSKRHFDILGNNVIVFSFRNTTLRFVSCFLQSSDVYWVVGNCKEFGCLLGGGREIWIWNWIWVKFGLTWNFFEVFFKNE